MSLRLIQLTSYSKKKEKHSRVYPAGRYIAERYSVLELGASGLQV